MNFRHAVVGTCHHSAQALQFDAERVRAYCVRAHKRPTAQRGNGERAEHEYFAGVCAELEGIQHVRVTGSHAAVSAFRHYADKHRPRIAARIVGLRGGRPSERVPTRILGASRLSEAQAVLGCGAGDRQAVEQPCRCITRPAWANERMA